jgi:hypothetical protein
MSLTADLASAPLAETVRTLHGLDPEQNAVHLGLDAGEAGWTRCRTLVDDPAAVRRWVDAYAAFMVPVYPAATPAELRSTAAACVLDCYSYGSGFPVGAMFHLARRVPRVDVDSVALRIHPVEHWTSGIALFDPRFWCLPDDPAADHPTATVVPDDDALAAVARDQVHGHAEEFLATFDPGVGIGRRARMGAFFDALDSAAWIVTDFIPPGSGAMPTSATLLPGGTATFPDASRLYHFTDHRGRFQVSRRRLFCCRSHLVCEPCLDCPRLTTAQRCDRATELPDPLPGTPDPGVP